MGYSITARRADGHECRLARQRYPDGVTHDSELPAIMFLEVEQAYLSYGGPKEDYRPYLVLVGRPSKFRADFPGNVKEVRFERELDQVPINYTYEFDREDLAKMAMKGLHEPGFDVPDIIRNNTFELPCRLETYMIWGDDGQTEFPLLFVRPEDGRLPGERNSLVCDNSSSGYKIGDYFEDSKAFGYDATKETGPLVRDIEDEMSKQEEQHAIGFERGDREGQWQDGSTLGQDKDAKSGFLTGMDYLGKEDDMAQPVAEEVPYYETEEERYRRQAREAAQKEYLAMRERAEAEWRSVHGADKSTPLGAGDPGSDNQEGLEPVQQDIDDRTEAELREAGMEAGPAPKTLEPKFEDAAGGAGAQEEFMPDEPTDVVEISRDPDGKPLEPGADGYEAERGENRGKVRNARINDAANIDTAEEVMEEIAGGGVDVRNSAYVDKDVVDAVEADQRRAAQEAASEGIPDIGDEEEPRKDSPRDRPLPDTSGIDAKEQQRLAEEAGLDHQK